MKHISTITHIHHLPQKAVDVPDVFEFINALIDLFDRTLIFVANLTDFFDEKGA